MGKRLTDNLSSLYIEAANRLQPKRARKRVVAYVESYDDVLFWRSVLADYEDETRYFEVMLPSKSTLAKGKKTVLMNQLGQRLGAYMIACVDSDYDYLLQGRTQTSRYMLECPYVLQTYAYAIENYLCCAETLHEAVVTATLNDHSLIDLEEFMRQYSTIAHPLFVWSIWFYRRHNLSEFSLMDFCSFVRLDTVNPRRPVDCLEQMAKRVRKKLGHLQKEHPEAAEEIQLLGEELRTLGVRPDNTYMFIQGHHLMNNVVLRLLTPLCTLLRREREEDIHRLARHKMQLQNELTAYDRSVIGVDQVLRKNTAYKVSPVYALIRKDVERLLKDLKEKGGPEGKKNRKNL